MEEKRQDIVIFFEGNDSKGMRIPKADFGEFNRALALSKERPFFYFGSNNSGLKDYAVKINLAQIRFIEIKESV